MAVQLREVNKSGPESWLNSARRTLNIEERGLAELGAAFDGDLGVAFCEAVSLMRSTPGRVILTGIGKSGHIARKIASTMASTGTPATYVHPVEASHGDLGMITPQDVILALSWSGETTELRNVVEYSRRFRIRLIAMTAAADSALARGSDLILVLPTAKEACPHGLAPTTSTMMQLALGDALAMALLEGRGFTAEQFRAFHPGGKLGASLHFVRDIMHAGDALPLVAPGLPMGDAIRIISEKGFGCVGVVDGAGLLVGVVTDGDLRRHIDNLLSHTVGDVMTSSPKCVPPDCLVGEALAMMNLHHRPFTVLFVVDNGRPVGIVHMHDFLRLGVM
jgi:arabinose-5-phosphate isomerase